MAAAIAALGLAAGAPAFAQTDLPEAAIPADGKGHGQIIATFYYSNSDKGFDRNGKTIDIADYQKLELYLLAEYNVTDKLTLVATPSLRDISVEGSGNDTRGLGYTELGARYRLVQGNGWSLSAQGTARIPGDTRRDSLAQAGSTNMEYDLRLRGTYGFAVGRGSGFVDVQGAYRLRDGAPPNEYHADVTAGYRPVPDLLLMAQSFNTFSDGSGRGIFDRYRYHNIQLSIVKDIAPQVSLQAGWLATLGGENALRERGAFGGVWIRF
ncbi:transporter [Novosphingobium beihaiensis]|uniref:Transporter n=1 Tax=Novosphingobium beihaiensis TaxID=2930389 RepID=A0ABT0BV05_9SPHN|nr:transporter [Novosphingobium beihaiensis]MCJ2188867.1 transporter [Novosphingobium beihaiensis]